MQTLKTKAITDAIILFVLFVIGFLYFSQIEAFELLVEFVHGHESWELDELITSMTLIGIAGFIYAIRRNRDAHAELIRRYAAEASVTWLAQNDALTELPNRHFLKGFQHRFDQASRGERDGRPHGVFSIDLDGFKQVNDLHGHFVGDQLLKEVARRLVDTAPNDLVVRLGGDEFLVVAEAEPDRPFDALAGRLSETICKPMVLDGVHAEVGCSIGYAIFPDQVMNMEEAARCADIAMYAAKAKGGNAIVPFCEDMGEKARRRAELEKQLRAAVSAGDIEPYYQPLVDLDTNGVYGFEILARWSLPGGQSIPPAVFIPLAEQTGLITELSVKLLDKACKDAKNWPSTLTLSFNLSPTQLSDRLIGLRIINILASNNILPQQLEVEITESAMVQDTETAQQILDELRVAGIRTALDDFGTGYSSLSQIAKLNFNRIKIDRSFVAEFESDERQYSIVKAIIALGEGLDVPTTAEGVETGSQLATLKALGCNCGQGFLLGQPMPATEADRIARSLDGNGEDGPLVACTAATA
jgi:diguanylate cyclase (GGDEF)-like protein